MHPTPKVAAVSAQTQTAWVTPNLQIQVMSKAPAHKAVSLTPAPKPVFLTPGPGHYNQNAPTPLVDPGPPPPPPFPLVNYFNYANGDAYVHNVHGNNQGFYWPPFQDSPSIAMHRQTSYSYNLTQAATQYMQYDMANRNFNRARMAPRYVYNEILEAAAQAALHARQTADDMAWAAARAATAVSRQAYRDDPQAASHV